MDHLKWLTTANHYGHDLAYIHMYLCPCKCFDPFLCSMIVSVVASLIGGEYRAVYYIAMGWTAIGIAYFMVRHIGHDFDSLHTYTRMSYTYTMYTHVHMHTTPVYVHTTPTLPSLAICLNPCSFTIPDPEALIPFWML